MHDIFVLYNRPKDPEAFDRHYISTHVPLVRKLPLLQDFTWGKVAADAPDAHYLVARLTYASKADADNSLASVAGRASVQDLENFAQAGATVLNVPRERQE
ncbi:EthD family reductase [Arthrobacter crystallopoietes]|uniref:EthD family reductase n=1 Tax=Crystallibacter crystallopoietes TaxID=37928 RepID=UPI00111118E1|nr:EthD family reductase [Arthrobacter crystallopoietes]